MSEFQSPMMSSAVWKSNHNTHSFPNKATDAGSFPPSSKIVQAEVEGTSEPHHPSHLFLVLQTCVFRVAFSLVFSLLQPRVIVITSSSHPDPIINTHKPLITTFIKFLPLVCCPLGAWKMMAASVVQPEGRGSSERTVRVLLLRWSYF